MQHMRDVKSYHTLALLAHYFGNGIRLRHDDERVQPRWGSFIVRTIGSRSFSVHVDEHTNNVYIFSMKYMELNWWEKETTFWCSTHRLVDGGSVGEGKSVDIFSALDFVENSVNVHHFIILW